MKDELKDKIAIWVLWVSATGIVTGFAGLWAGNPTLHWCGIVLALPLYVIFIPQALICLVAAFTRPLWLPFVNIVMKRHGAPFHSGDLVTILKGHHRGRKATVYEIWDERSQVRLDLGETEKEEFTDVFSFLSVQKTMESEPKHAR